MSVNNMFNNNMESLKLLLQKDTTINKPKIITINGVLTKKFKKWNKKMLLENKTLFYSDPLYYFNQSTKRINKIPVDKRFTNITPKKSFLLKNDKFKGGYIPKLLTNKPTYNFKFTLDSDNSEGGTEWTEDKNLFNNNLLRLLINDNNISGNWRLIIKNNSNKEPIIDGNFLIDGNFWRTFKERFRDNSEYMIWNSPEINDDGDEIIFIFTKETKLSFLYYNQKFLDGDTHCLFTPILEYMELKVKESKTKTTKVKYMGKVNKIIGKKTKDKRTKKKIGYLTQYKNGIEKEDLADICEDLQIGIDIEQPFLSSKLFEYRSTIKPLKVFKFINTRINHVEAVGSNKSLTYDNIFKCYDNESISKEELKDLKEDCIKKKELCIYNKNIKGEIIQLRTLTNNYSVKDDYHKTVNDWEKEHELNLCDYDYINNETLHNYIIKGTHFNGTIDFKSTIDYYNNDNIPLNMKHIDMTKAYTQFKQCDYYNGFMGKITDFRKVDNYEEKGLYYITDLDLKNCDKKFIILNKKLQWFHNNNIYTDQELTALAEYGGKFNVEYGAMGIKTDFDFSKEMIEKTCDYEIKKKDGTIKILKLPYYCKWAGMNVMANKNKNFFMEGNKEYFENFDLKNDIESNIWVSKESDEARVSYAKKFGYNKPHITAQITAYQRLIMLKQLLNMDTEKLVRICVDGIYYEDHAVKMLKCFSYKTKMTFKNSPCSEYLSNLNIDNSHKSNYYLPEDTMKRQFVKTELFDGAGGVGKTYHNLIKDNGFVNSIYVPHSWKLATNKKKEYEELFNIEKFLSLENRKYYKKPRLNTSVHSYLFNKHASNDDILSKYNVVIIDECSMLTELQKQYIIEKVKGKVIFMGDIDCQLKPVINKDKKDDGLTKQQIIDSKIQMTRKGLDLITTLKINYRFKCDKLKKLANLLRTQIGNKKFNYKKLKNVCKFINREEIKTLYKKEDIILCYNRDNIYNKMFQHIKISM